MIGTSQPPSRSLDTTPLRLAVAVMFAAASIWLAYQFWRLLFGGEPVWSTSPVGAADLKLFHRSVHDWFIGRPIYSSAGRGFYPPATYLILWPFLGWLDVTAARWLWAMTAVASLAWLARVIVVESGASSTLESCFVVLMLLASYPAGATIGNGQLTVHILPPLVTGILMLSRTPQNWRRDVLGSVLILASLAKPAVSAPFFWLVLFSSRGMRPAMLVLLGYASLTALAVSFQGASLASLSRDWIAVSAQEATQGGYADLNVWMDALGLGRWMLELSLAALLGLGVWAYRHRHQDLWMLLGVVAIATHFWVHHRWYDDVVLVLPMVTLFRTIKQCGAGSGDSTVPGLLLACGVMIMLAPGGLYLLPPPWTSIYVAAHTFVWLGVMSYFVRFAGKDAILGGPKSSNFTLGSSSNRGTGSLQAAPVSSRQNPSARDGG